MDKKGKGRGVYAKGKSHHLDYQREGKFGEEL